MKNFEDQLKDAFDGFEPEAPSSVWNQVQSSISSPLAPAAAAKVITTKLGWIAAAVITTVIAVTLLVVKPWNTKNNSQANPATTVKSEVNTSTTPNETPSNEKAIIPNVTPSATLNSDITSTNNKLDENNDKKAGATVVTATPNSTVVSAVNNQNMAVVNTSASTTINTIGYAATSNNNSSNNSVITDIKNQEPAILIANAKAGFAPLSVTFMVNTGKSTDINFGDGSTAYKTSSVTHKFTKPGVYEVSCVLNDKEITIKITVLNDLGSAFSPNGDGINDNFIVGGDDIRDLTVNVYDRSGKRVFSGNTNNCMWDGSLNDGQKAETGTYFYDIFATTVEGENFKQKGTINLFR